MSDVDGEALVGVSVTVAGTIIGTVTDLDGNFALSVPVDAKTLQVKYIGMKDKSVPIVGSILNIIMDDNSAELDEVVVIGYGTIKKNDLTGSVGSISSDKITAKGTTSVMESMQGQVAGVEISQSSSRAVGKFNIQIRGKSSMQSGGVLLCCQWSSNRRYQLFESR